MVIRSVLNARDAPCITDREIRVDSPSADSVFNETQPLGLMKKVLEKRYLETQLRKHAYDLNETAERLGILVNNLYRKIRELGIPLPKG